MSETISISELPDFSIIANDKERVDTMCTYVMNYCNVYPANCLVIAEDAYNLAYKIDYGEGQSWALDHIGYQHWHLGKIEQAKEEFEKSRKLQEKHKFYRESCWHYQVWAMVLWQEGKYDEAFTMVYDGIRIAEENNVVKYIGMLYWALGVFYYDLKDYTRSLNNYNKAFDHINTDLVNDFNSVNAMCYTLIGLGCSNKGLGNKDEALEYFNQALKKSKEGKQWMQEARSHYEIGVLLSDDNKLDKAETELKVSYEMRKQHHTKPAMVSSLIALCDVEIKRNNLSQSMLYMEEALELAKASKSKAKEYQCRHKLYELQKMQGSYKEALMHMEEYHRVRQEVVGEEASNKLKNLQTKHATEQSEKEAEIQRLRNVELKKAHDLVAEKNREIMDSINYAKRIQSAILPPDKNIKELLPESFVLYKPKDIVAGDFYWLETSEDKVLLAAADCTGHGVPGAMVSVVCNNGLNRSVREHQLIKPSEILDKTRDIVVTEFEKSEEEVKDGMDIALCSLGKNVLQYAGANNPLYVISNGELTEIKADKQPIGRYDHKQPFTNHSITLKTGDCVYIFTDGFADQFGGPKGKKFKYSQFKQLLLDNHQLPMDKQKELLNNTIEDWKGELEQVDDICVIGIRVH